MARIKCFERPGTIEEAVGILVEKKGAACVLAGGTSVAVRPPAGVDTLVDLSRLGLKGLREAGDSVAIMACTTVAELLESSFAQTAYGGVLARAAARVASTPLRNLITVGGNAVQVYPWSDLPGVLLALEAKIVLAGPNARTVPAAAFFAAHPRTHLKPGDIVTEIRIPKPIGRANGSFVKAGRTAVDYAALSVTAICQFSGPQVRQCAVAIGSLHPLPLRSPQAEEEITGKIPTRDDFIRAGARAAGAHDPSADVRYSKEYRRQLVKVWVKRCLYEAAN
jgi:carbon-monoxide dehydrogenase medium subunit